MPDTCLRGLGIETFFVVASSLIVDGPVPHAVQKTTGHKERAQLYTVEQNVFVSGFGPGHQLEAWRILAITTCAMLAEVALRFRCCSS
eukprot:2226484-Amphidinium_carterae.1